MKRAFVILFVFFTLAAPLQEAFAEEKVSEGYALTSMKELVKTIIGMEVLDINDIKIADEYARLVYCNIYRKSYSNDVEWNEIRKKIISDVMEKREYYRVMYEVHGIFKLGRYNFETQFFSISENLDYEKSAVMRNVISIDLFLNQEYTPHCGINGHPTFFMPNVVLKLNKPMTVDRFEVPMEKVEGILVRMKEAKNVKRTIYGRIRVRITGPLPIIKNSSKIKMKGDVMSVDFFLDPEMTKYIGGTQFFE